MKFKRHSTLVKNGRTGRVAINCDVAPGDSVEVVVCGWKVELWPISADGTVDQSAANVPEQPAPMVSGTFCRGHDVRVPNGGNDRGHMTLSYPSRRIC
jgi:hypothetical protein